MDNLEQIKQQLEELTSKVNSIQKSEGQYMFTEEEMIKFVKQLGESFLEHVKNIDFNVDIEANTSLDLYDKTIELNIDNDEITRDFLSQMDLDYDEDSILYTITDLYKKVKNI